LRLGGKYFRSLFYSLAAVLLVFLLLTGAFLPQPAAPAAADEPAAEPEDITATKWWPYAAAACGVILIASLAVYFTRRRNAGTPQ
jgi:hypothetical protein